MRDHPTASGCDNPPSAQPCCQRPPCSRQPPQQPCCVPRQQGPTAGASCGPDDFKLMKQEVKTQVPSKTTFPPVAVVMGSCYDSSASGRWSASLDSKAWRRSRGQKRWVLLPPGFGTGVSPGYNQCQQSLQPALSLFLCPVLWGCPAWTGLQGAALAREACGDSSGGLGQVSSAPSLHSPLWFLLCRWQQERTGSL